MELNHLNNELFSSVLDTGSITSWPRHVVSVVRVISDLELISACFCVLYKYSILSSIQIQPPVHEPVGNGQVYQLILYEFP